RHLGEEASGVDDKLLEGNNFDTLTPEQFLVPLDERVVAESIQIHLETGCCPREELAERTVTTSLHIQGVQRMQAGSLVSHAHEDLCLGKHPSQPLCDALRL